MSYGPDLTESFERALGPGRSHLQGRQARRSAVRAADPLSVRDQSEDGKEHRPRYPADAARTRRRSDRVRRREFIALLGGAAVAASGSARAQQDRPAYRRADGICSKTIRRPGRAWPLSGEGLEQLGWKEGRNVADHLCVWCRRNQAGSRLRQRAGRFETGCDCLRNHADAEGGGGSDLDASRSSLSRSPIP